MSVFFLFSCTVLLSISLWHLFKHLSRSAEGRPPGPKGQWLVGHTFQVPKTKTWLYFEKLGKQYGPLVNLTLAGDEMLILNDSEDAEELLGRRSHNYSSRKPIIYAGKYISHDQRLMLLPYGSQLKKRRSAVHQMLQPKAVDGYQPMQLLESSKLLYDMLTCPQDAFLNTKRFSSSLAFTLSYGRRQSPDDADLKEVLSILDDFIDDCYPGRHLVDTFQFLDSAWIPKFLTKWRAEASRKHEREITFYLRLLHEVKSRMDSGEPQLECFSARLWEQQKTLDLDLESMAYVAGSAFEAGTGTTAGTLMFFLMAMILHPDVLRKAQQEIDGVLKIEEGPPTFEHMKDLPYCFALCKEVFRWLPVAPGGFPHYSDRDDVYKGYTIREKTMVIPNIWAMQHNERVFQDPLTFRPERFLKTQASKSDGPDTLTSGHWAFGFGRRICPGQHMGSRSVWIGITQLLWGFDIKHALDVQGNPIPIDTEAVTSGITIEPEPFEMCITPRSATHADRIRRLWAEYEHKIVV